MKSILALRRVFASAFVLLAFLALAAPQAMATHLRGGTISWKVVSTTSSTYTVQFTFSEAQRWSYPNTAGICTGTPSACVALNSTVALISFTGTGEFVFGDGSANGDPSGTITSINQANDYATATFTFNHTYNNSANPYTAYFYATNRLSTLKLGSNEPEYISATVQNYPNGSPVAAVPAVLAVPLPSPLGTVSFDLGAAVTDIDPNANLIFTLSTVAELYGPSGLNGITSIPCPSGNAYTPGGVPSGQPPGFSISPAGLVTWNTTLIQPAISSTGANCGFGAPVAGDLWPAQIMVEAVNKTTGALITQVPVDLLMEFVSPVGALPTMTLSPSGTQTIEVGAPVTFTATGKSTNAGTKVTLNASGVPAGATASGLNATVTPPATSNFSWTPTSGQTGTFVVSYTVTDSNLQQATASETIVVANLQTVTCSTPITVTYGQSGTLSTTLYDPSNYPLNVVWTVDGTSVQTNSGVVAYPNPATVNLSQNFGDVGLHVVKATATEPSGVAVSCTTSATVTRAAKTITFPQPTTPVTAGSSATLAATASNNDSVTYTVTAGTATISGSTIIYTNAGTVTIAANSAQTIDYAAAATVSDTVVVNAAASSYTAPTEDVGSTSPTQTAAVTFTTAGTLDSINVVTKGAPNLDFNQVPGGTCVLGQSYTAGQACTVEYSFTPLYPGAREGAVVLQTSGGSVLGTSYLGGTGIAPLGLFTTTSQTLSVTGLSGARGLSADGYGNLYVLETLNGNVDKIAAGTNTVTTLTNIANTGSGGTAVDGAGNLYVGATGATTIYELVGGKLPVITVVTGTCGSDDNLEVDGAGNLYFSCYTSQGGAIYKVNTGSHSLTQLLPGNVGHRFVALASDAAGNIYAPDFSNNILYELPFGTNSLTTLVSGGALSSPHGVAVDPAGNIYVTNYSGSTYKVLRYAASGYALTQLPATGSRGIVIDGSGNLYTIQSNDATITGYARTTAPGLTFPSTPVGTSSNSSQTVEFENDGNAPLVITDYSATTNFNVGGSGNTCATGTLASGASCFVGAQLAPTAVGTLTGTASIVDNTLGIAGTSQDIPLSGTATLGSKTISFPALATPVTALTSASLSATASNGDPVIYSITLGTATISGSTVTYTTAGTVTIAANSAATSTYAAAAQVTRTIVVNQIMQTIAFTAPASPVTYPTGTIALSATGGASGNAVVFSIVSGPGSISGSALTVNTAGTIVIAANQAGNTNYTAATQVTRTVVVNQGAQAIAFTAPASPVTYGAAPVALVATGGNSTKPVVFSVLSGPGAISGSTLSYTGAGTVVLAANQAGDVNYTAAPQVTQTVVVNQAPQTINFSVLPSPVIYGVGSIPLAATGGASSNGVIFTVISGPAVISGNSLTIVGAGIVVVAADQAGNANYLAATQAEQTIVVMQAPKTIAFPALPSPVAVNSTATLAATTSNGDPIIYSITSGAATISGTAITFTNAGTVTIAADSTATANYLAAATVSVNVVVNAAPSSYTAPTEPVGSTTATQTAIVNFTTAGTLSAINVVTQGATGLDFNFVSGGTCAIGTSYTAGQACTVQYRFKPQAPGTRLGAITLISDSGALLGTSYLGGTGTGPQAIFSNGGQSAFQDTSSYSYLNGITTDASGNVYFSSFNGGVYKIPVGGVPTQLVGGLGLADGVAIDGAGNVFYTDYNAGTVNELLGGFGTPLLIATEPNPEGLAFDAQGNLYVVVSGNQNVVKLLAGSFTPSTTYGTGIVHPQSVAVDASGNVYITDRDGAKAVVITPDGATQTTIANGIATPAGITLDAAGNIYIAVIGGAELEEYAPGTPGTYTPTTLGSFVQPAFVALDPSGNVLVVDRGTNTIQELTRATPAPLSFATTSEGSTSSDSPQTVTLTNDGNASLVLSGLSTASANFSLSGSSTCSSSTTLAVNGSCNIGVNFAPTVPGSPLTDAVTIADNNLNVAGAVQTVTLSGTGTQQTAIVTVAPATISYTTDPTTLSASVAYLGVTAPSGAVSFTIDGSGAVPAICVGSASPLTCTASYPTGTLSATTHTITATLAADTDFTTTSGSATLAVTPIAPTITFTVPNHTYGDASFTLLAASNSAAPITYSLVSGPATVSGPTLSITGAGPVTVQAAQIAAGNYIAGSQNASFTVAQLTLTAAIVGNPTKTYDSTTGATLSSANYQLSPLVGSDAITVTQPSGVYASATAGSEGVTAALSGANFSAVSGLLSNYILPAMATGPGTITQAATSSTIIWNTPAAIIYGTALSVAQLNASSAIAGSFSYSPAAGTVLGAATQTLTATFTPTDTTDYMNGNASVTLLVNQATPTINWPAPAAITYGAALSATQLNATASVAGTLSYNPAVGSVLTAGPQVLSVTFTPTDTTDYTSATSTVMLTVNQATPAITWPAPAAITYGAGLNGTQLDASSTVAGTFSYSPASGVLTAGLRTLSVTFTPTDTTDYTSATSTVMLTVNQATPTITWATPAAITYGAALSGAQLNATASVAGAFSYSPAGGVLTAGSQLLSVTFTPTDGTDYTTATSTVTLTVNQATPTISWANPVAISYGTHLSATQLNATASVAGTLSYNPAAGSVLTVGPHLLSVTFTPTDGTDYTTATATVSLTVAPIALTITSGSPTTIYGSTLPTIAPSYSGFIFGDSASSLTTQPTCTTTATSASNVGSYPTSCSGAVDANYIISYKPGTLTVTPAVLTVAANKLTFAYGGGDGDNDADSAANPLTYTITGFALGQTAATDLTGTPSETSNTPEGGPVGSYTITMAAGSLKLKSAYSSNYTISYVSAPLTIVQAVLTVTAASQSDVYGAVDPDNCGHPERHLAYTITGFAYNQKQNQVLDGSPTLTTTATAKSNVGSYPITITQGSLSFDRNYASNYTLVFVNGTLTVTPAKLNVVANSYSRKINQPNPAFGYTINGFVNGDSQTSATTGAPACCSTAAITSSPAGIYAITIAPGSLAAKNGNYTLNFVNGVLVVYNPRDRNDAHCDGNGNYSPNRQFDNDNWPDSSSYNYYWGNGGGGPNITH